MERNELSDNFPLGSKLPTFSLPNAGGGTIDNSYFQNAPFSLVVFSCNHCPYVIGSEEMLFATIQEFQAKGLKAVLISSNDPVQYPEDSFDKMKAKANTVPCPYLFDESQEIARIFDAQCTPECYLFDKNHTLIFHGTVNNSPRYPEQVNANFLNTALGQAMDGLPLNPPFVHPIGCSIKWKV